MAIHPKLQALAGGRLATRRSAVNWNANRLLWIVLLFLAASPQAATAGILLRAESVTVQSHPLNPVSGFFDVFLEYDGAPVGATAAGYNFGAVLAPNAAGIVAFDDGGVSEQGAIVAGSPQHPSHSPLFPDRDPLDALFNTFPSQTIQVADTLPSGSLPVFNGAALASVRYTVAPGAVGTFDVTFDPDISVLFDSLGTQLIDNRIGGTITVVPEPASGIVLAIGAAGFAVLELRRRGRRRVQQSAE
jgi:hypothetical protein